jgi:glycosyltransferase involved in cell wall biosynthesis/phosphoheptose isomerase
VKIAMISEHASPLATLGGADAGGQNVHVDALARGLALRGHEVRVYTRREDPLVPECVPLSAGAAVVHVPVGPARPIPKDELLPHMSAFAQWVVDDWTRSGLPDIVHSHFWMSGLAALEAAGAHGLPVVQTFHALGTVKRRFQGNADTSPGERVALECKVAREVDLVLATCQDEVDELRAMVGHDADDTRVVPCGVDTAVFSPFGPASPPGPARLLSVGRMVPRKGYDTAVRALALLPDTQTELVIAGGAAAGALAADPEVQRLRALAEELHVDERVTFTGGVSRAEMPQLYRDADVVLATPWYEPFGITPLEAAACGRPVVGSAVGGLLDTVVDGTTGRLVPPRDPHALAEAVHGLLADRAAAARMGAAARERAVARYDWQAVTAATEQAYFDVIASRRGPDRTAARSARDQDDASSWIDRHAEELRAGLASLSDQHDLLQQWGQELAAALPGGARLLAAGNGGSAAEAQHLTAELVGRFCGERRPLSALSLCSESSSVTAILNDYGADEVFARQVEAHGRPGDVLVLLSTSGTSSNVVHAAKRGHEMGMRVWALTGPAPNPLASLADQALTIDTTSTAAVQEVQLVAVHALCAVLDATLASRGQLMGPLTRGVVA